MPFGLGIGELVVVLLVMVVPITLLVLAAKIITGLFGHARGRPDEIAQANLVGELQQAQIRIEELEAKVARVDEKASFTQELLEKPRTGS